MRRTWIVVAHRIGARIFEPDAESRELGLVQELEHPDGRKKASDIDTDKPGMSYTRGTAGGGHPMSTAEGAHDHAARTFAREIAGALRQGRVENRYQDLVLVAEPRFLGMLRESLDGPTAQTVDATIEKDLAKVPVHELPKHLSPVLGPPPSRRL